MSPSKEANGIFGIKGIWWFYFCWGLGGLSENPFSFLSQVSFGITFLISLNTHQAGKVLDF